MQILSKILIVLALSILVFPNTGSAASLKSHQNLSKRFLRTVKIPVTRKQPIDHVLYGNDIYGYFVLDLFKRKGPNLVVKIVPPGYSKAISFYIGYRKGNKTTYRKSGTKRFKSPVPKAYAPYNGELVYGKFSPKYFMVGGALAKQKLVDPNFTTKDDEIFKKDKYRYTYLQILNRFGEIVWIHVPTQNNAILSSYMQARPVGSGKYGMLFGKKAGYFQMVDYRGKVQHQFSSRFNDDPFTMHHDFTMTSPNRLLTISNKVATLKPSEIKDPSKKTNLSDVLVEVNLKTKEKRTRLDFVELFHPTQTPYFTGDKEDDKKFVIWGEPKADFEFTHVNGIEYYPGKGYLVSIRNLNKIAMLNKKLNKVLWTLGPNKDDTYRIKSLSDQFTHQHTPTLLKNGNLMLFNNGRTDKSSNIVVYKLNKKKKEAKAIWVYAPSPKLFSKNRSSVFPMRNGNILAYFVSPAIEKNKKPPRPNVDHLMEIDRNGKRVGYMKRTFDVLSPGYRALPLYTLGVERYVGNTLKEAKKKARKQ